MRVLGVRKFFLDYLVASVLILLTLYLALGGITVMDIRTTIGVHQSCSEELAAEEVKQHLQSVLREGEQCEVISPCDEWQSVRCTGALQASDLYAVFLGGDLLVYRVKDVLNEPYGVISYKDRSTFRFQTNFVIFFMFYVLLLIEAGAMLFALWRQGKLKQTFALPVGLKKDQLIKPGLLAILSALAVIFINILVFWIFDYPQKEDEGLITSLLNSAYGIVALVVLAPLVEELIFRGVLLRFFVEKKRVWLGTVIVSLLFSIIHGFAEADLGWQVYISSNYFIVSILLCWLYIKQKNLWSPIIFHSAYNSTLVIVSLVFSPV